MNRRVFLLALVAATALGGGVSFGATVTTRLNAATMKASLRTGTPDQEKFIDQVMALVNAGKLAPDLVDSTFQWARKKPEHKFEYFQNALMVRAKKQGIDVAALIKSLSTAR